MTWYFSRKEQYAVAVLLVAILGALLVLCYAYGRRDRQVATGPVFTPSAPAATASQPPEQLVVHVTGAVNKPDVYSFPAGARINDAIQRAGGARADGYPDALNRAEKLKDGEKICVPTKEEWTKATAQAPPPLTQTDSSSTAIATSPTRSSGASDSSAGKTSSATAAEPSGSAKLSQGKVSINTATKEQLMSVKGIGPVTAQHILDYRAQHGKFTDLSELLNISRIGPKTLEKLEPHLTL